MSNNSNRKASQSSADLYTTLEQQFAQGFIEVETTGLSLRRLVAVYTLLGRQAWQHLLGGMRSHRRHPAAQA